MKRRLAGTLTVSGVILCISFSALIYTQFALAQQKKVAKPESAQTVPLSSTEVGLKITKLLLQQSRIQAAYNSCQQTMQAAPQQFAQAQVQINQANDEAFKSQGLSKIEYSFDDNTLTFTRIASTPAKEPEKKGAQK